MRVSRECLPAEVPQGLALVVARQVHGGAATVVERPSASLGGATEPPEADALVAVDAGFCLAVLSADCVPVALGSPEGPYAAVHAGWRGLLSGVIETAIEAMRSLGAERIVAGIGPCIHACCYSFGDADLSQIVERYGEAVRATTARGEPSLDLPQAVSHALAGNGVELAEVVDVCTSCSSEYFSHRARKDAGRQALLVWSVRAAG